MFLSLISSWIFSIFYTEYGDANLEDGNLIVRAYLVSIDILKNTRHLIIGMLLLFAAKMHLGHVDDVEFSNWVASEDLIHILASCGNDDSMYSV
jgi:hypothetical protein